MSLKLSVFEFRAELKNCNSLENLVKRSRELIKMIDFRG